MKKFENRAPITNHLTPSTEHRPLARQKSTTQLWAEASANYHTGKDEMEKLCCRLSEELIHFDRRKELELKQVLIEYAESRGNIYETMQSKWFGIKLMLNCDINPDIRGIDFNNVRQTKRRRNNTFRELKEGVAGLMNRQNSKSHECLSRLRSQSTHL